MLLLAVSVSQNTSQVGEIRAKGAQISNVIVTSAITVEVDPMKGETSGPRDTSIVVVEARLGGRVLPLEGRLSSFGGVHRGDQIWALYAASSPSVGAVLAERRSELEDLMGGPMNPLHLAIAALPGLVGAHRLWKMRRNTAVIPGEDPVASAVHSGRARALRVRVNGLCPALLNRAMALRLTAADGDRDFLLGNWVDAETVAKELDRREGWLYWAPTSSDQSSKSNRNKGDAAKVSSVLVLGDGRYVKGHTSAALNGSMPKGEKPGRLPADACPDVHPVERDVLWRPRLRPLSLFTFCLGLAVVVAMLTLPVGDLSDDGTINTTILFLAPMVLAFAWNRISRAEAALASR
jgi:hypothetical protein